MDPMGLGIQNNFQESLGLFIRKDIYSKGAGNVAFNDLFWDRGNVTLCQRLSVPLKIMDGSLFWE